MVVPKGRGLVSVIDQPSTAIAYVTNPSLRSGCAVGIVDELMRSLELEHIVLFAAGSCPTTRHPSAACSQLVSSPLTQSRTERGSSTSQRGEPKWP
jgi:hypothetical protein